MQTKWLIEVKDITPTMYFAGYEIKKKRDCPSGEDRAILFLFTEDVYSAKKYPSKKFAEDYLKNMPMIKIYCHVIEHGFGE